MAEIMVEHVGTSIDKEKFDTRWWAYKPEEQASHIFQTVAMIKTRQNYRSLQNIKNARLYGDLDIVGFWTGIYQSQMRNSPFPNRVSLNVVKSCTDTVTAKIAKSKPRPMFLTEDGDWPLQQKAKKLTKFIDGQFAAMDHYEVKQDTFRDSGIFGTGLSKFYIDWKRSKICSERVIPEEIIIDDNEAIYGYPRCLYQERLMNKDVLKDMVDRKFWPAIDEASFKLESSGQAKDLVKVIEAFHLPSGPDANDGHHTTCIDTETLGHEEWEFDWFPYSKETWTKGITGWYGIGIAQELTGIQLEINKILRNIQLSTHLFAIPRVFVENASQVNLAAINNDIGAIIKYTMNKPEFYTPQAMSPDVYAHLWNLYAKAYEITGVSQLSASSKKPEGLDSGKAIREYQDVESERFQIVGQRRDQSFLHDARICIEFAKKLSKKNGDFKVKVSDQGTMKTIRWSDVNLEEEKYMMRSFPTSILPTQPAAKMATIVEYTQAGFFDMDTAMDLMDFPDIEAATSKIISPRRLVFKMLDEMVDDGDYQPPEPFMNVGIAKNYSQLYYMDAKQKGVPEDRLELIRTFITDCVTLEQTAMQAAKAAMAAAAPPTQPIGQPNAQPTNDLLPVAPPQSA